MKNGAGTNREGDGPRFNLFGPCSLSQRLNEGHDVYMLVSLPVTKPERQNYFRARPEMMLETKILGLKQDRQSIFRKLTPYLPDITGHGTD